MWVDETDATQLAQRLRLGPRELVQTLGGPWTVVWRVPERESERPGTLVVGRAGPSVAILLSDDPDPRVTVGRAVGEWVDLTTLQWSVTDVEGDVTTPHVGAATSDVDRFIADLGALVDSAFDRAAPTLVTCRYCRALVAPVHAMGEERCARCAMTLFGIVH